VTQSMTGFARGSVTTPAFTVIVELRSVNNRYLDLHFRCPENLRNQEPAWRKTLSSKLDRGKVEVNLRVQAAPDAQALSINPQRLAQLHQALTTIGESFPEAPVPDRLSLLLAPGVVVDQDSDEKELAHGCQQALAIALNELTEQRRREGEALAELVRSRVQTMASMLADLREQLPLLRERQQQRLLERLAQIGVDADQKRLEEEMVYAAQRSDVDEEMDRLDAHLEAILEALQSNRPCGRRLDFLMQELNREANTLSSKSTALTTTNTAVEFKVLIEQMREQIQNIE